MNGSPTTADCPLAELVTYTLEDFGDREADVLVIVSGDGYYGGARDPSDGDELYLAIANPEAGQTYRVRDFLFDDLLADGDAAAEIELRSSAAERGDPSGVTNTVELEVFTPTRAAGTLSAVYGVRVVTATFDVEL